MWIWISIFLSRTYKFAYFYPITCLWHSIVTHKLMWVYIMFYMHFCIWRAVESFLSSKTGLQFLHNYWSPSKNMWQCLSHWLIEIWKKEYWLPMWHHVIFRAAYEQCLEKLELIFVEELKTGCNNFLFPWLSGRASLAIKMLAQTCPNNKTYIKKNMLMICS